MRNLTVYLLTAIISVCFVSPELGFGQGITTANLSGNITDSDGNPLAGANVVATHEPTGTQYGAAVRDGGQYDILSMRVGGPYTVRITYIGYKEQSESDVYLSLGQTSNLDFRLVQEAVQGAGVLVTAEMNDVLNSGRTGAASYISSDQVEQMPSVKRSIRDLTRLDPRSDGNYSFGGRNWLYNSISLDGSYFNNPFGLDDPAPGGQAGAEPVSFDAVEQVQVSVAPFDVREGGFTGAGINTVTKSGTNRFHGSVYDYTRNQSMVGNSVGDVDKVIEDPNLSFNQAGFTLSGPIIQNKLFFFVNAEVERRTDPGTNYTANTDATVDPGESRVDAATMQAISDRMKEVYGYDTGPFQGYDNKTDNNKMLLKLDWNLSSNHNATFRVNVLDAERDLGPHPFVLSFANTGRGPNTQSLPFQNSGYQINNDLTSYAFELNSTFSGKAANRFFFSFNKFRDFRQPRSADFPTIDIGEDGVTYTTLGHEPFSIHNILDQDVLQITDNYSYFSGNHIYTAGVSYERFNFFNSFNIFRHGVFFLPDFLDFIGGATFSSVDDFMRRTGANPDSADFIDFKAMIASSSSPFKGENIEVGQFSVYAQDEFQMSDRLRLTYGLRVDVPLYFTDPIANPFSTDSLSLPEPIDQADLPSGNPLYSPRIGFNFDVNGDRTFQLRGGTGVFTGRLPFVWVGNVISNPGSNPNLYSPFGGAVTADENITDDGSGRHQPGSSVLQQSFDLNAMSKDFKWPQVWTTNFAVDKQMAGNWLGTIELVYGKDLNAIFMKNLDLPDKVRNLKDGRPYYTNADGVFERNPDGGAGVYVIDNISEGYNFTLTGQLRKEFDNGLSTGLAYTYLKAKNNLKSTEIASVLWQNQPVQGDPNNPQLGASEFGNPQRIIANMNYMKNWSDKQSTSFGVFFERTQGNRFIASGGNRYSFIYSGDVNGDGYGGNDLIYIPTESGDIVLSDPADWAALDAFIKQDDYLKDHRGEIAERMGSINPWYTNLDLRILHNVQLSTGDMKHKIQLSLDILNVANLLNSSWGVRQIASPAATSPLTLTGFDANGEPILDFTGPTETFVDDLSLSSRYQIQVGVRYLF